MESIEINIATFINPHCFFITEADSKHRSSLLRDLSTRIKKSHCGYQNDSFSIDEMVAVYYESDLVRGVIVQINVNEETHKTLYGCWLVDYAILIHSERVFKIPKEIQKITPRAKQACLNNFCYLKEQLELGVTGKIKTVPSIIPSSGVSQYCLDALAGYSKLVFEVGERYENILIGEIVIHKTGKVLYLTRELCNRGLIVLDENIFQRIKYGTKDYIKMNLEAMYQVCKTPRITRNPTPVPESETSVSLVGSIVFDNMEDADIDNLQMLENGRRRRGIRDKRMSFSQTSTSEDDHTPQLSQNKIMGLLKEVKKKLIHNTLNENNNIPELGKEKSTNLTESEQNSVGSAENNLSTPTLVISPTNRDNAAPIQSSSEAGKAKSPRPSEILKQKKALEEAKKAAKEKYAAETKKLTKSIDLTESQMVSTEKNISSSTPETSPKKRDAVTQKLSSSESENAYKPTVSKPPRPSEILKKKKALEQVTKAAEEKNAAETESLKISDETCKKLAELRRRKLLATSSCSTRSEEEFDSSWESGLEENKIIEQKSEETKQSPFGDITSGRKTKPLGLFLPAGMEGRYNKEKHLEQKVSKSGKSDRTKFPLSKIPSSSTPDDDCPTIKIPKPSGNLTDDQISADETKDKSETEKDEKSSDSPPEIFTKQDFCKLIAGCTCIKCRITLEDDDWDAPIKFESDKNETKKTKKSTGPVMKPPTLLRQDVENEIFVQENEILSIDYSGMSVMEKKMSCKVLVHGESIPNPIKRVAQVNIHRHIYNNISRLSYKEAKRIQHYAFPAITRNQHVFMINDAGSGKTMAYLPILSSFIMEKEERYGQLLKMGGGPIVVILCSNSKKCEEVFDLMKLIFNGQRCRISLVTYPRHGNISSIDILITMPVILTSLISLRATNFKRLCHFVLEDGDVMLKSHNDAIKKFLDYGNQVLEHRHCPKSIQIILCAEHWTSQIESVLKTLNKVPLVCIGNHLEAALYGKINFTMKFLDTGCKEQNLQTILHDVYKFTRSVIICNSKEMEEITDYLPLKGIEYTAITGRDEEDTLYKEVSWSNATPGKYSVLVCTDDIYNTINVTNAQLLIHYSLPRSWTQFIRRFSCLLENNPTPLNIKQRKESASTFVFIDENCEQRMSKFCNFIKIAGLEKSLPENIKSYFKDLATDEERKRVDKKIELCETLRIFGECISPHCKKRHILHKVLDHSSDLPKNGSINFKITKMTSVSTCSIQLLEHFDIEGQSVQKYEDFTDHISEALAEKQNYQNVSKLIENHLYLHKDGDEFWRCKLVELDEMALVYLIDRGIYCNSDLDKLFKMPQDLKKIPPQCYEAHLANLIPPHADTKFSRSAKHKAQFLVDGHCANSVMSGQIVLQLGNNLWLDDVCEVRDMYDKSLPSIGYQLAWELVKQELAVKNDKPLGNLYNLAKQADIVLFEYEAKKPKIKKVIVEQQAKPQWAFLDMGTVNQVQFSCAVSPGEFYVKLQKFSEQQKQLELDIQSEIRKPFYPVPQKIEIGKCYLVKDEPTGNYCRGLVLNIFEGEAHVFCVDFGDDIYAPLSSLKHISNNLILKLPFQTVQCSMYGNRPIDDSWCVEATSLLYKMAFEEDSDIFRTLFVRSCSKRASEMIPEQNSYSVIVKEGFSARHLLLNELLIDCGFAVPTGDTIEDFELPEQKEESEEEEIEEIIRCDGDTKVEVEFDLPQDCTFDYDAFDLEIFDLANFLTETKLPVRKIEDSKAIEGRTSRDDNLPPMRAAPTADYLTPDVYWSQTDSSIKLAIKITDVQEPKIALKHNRIFIFETQRNEKKYHLDLFFYAKVEKTFQYTVLGPEVRVILCKCAKEEWPRLLRTTEKMKKLHFDLSTIKDDEKPRRLLQLDISDSDSEGDENDGMVYHVCSDMDSEYDYDIPNDEAV